MHTRLLVAAMFTAIILSACSNAPQTSPTPTPPTDAETARGLVVFNKYCATCHATVPDTIIVGPSLSGIASRAGGRVSNLDTRGYIEQSILKPDAFMAPGFKDVMAKDLGKKMSSEELDAVVTYLLTLK